MDTQDEGGDIERFKHDVRAVCGGGGAAGAEGARQARPSLTRHVCEQARKIIRGLSPQCEPKMSIDAGAYQFKWVIPSRGPPAGAQGCEGGGSPRAATHPHGGPSPPCGASYMIERGVCYLTMCERDYPKRLAFAFLADLRSELESHLFAEHGDLWEQHIDAVRRPYAFIKFGATEVGSAGPSRA